MFETEVTGKLYDGQSSRAHSVVVTVCDHKGSPALEIAQKDETCLYWPTLDLRELSDQARNEGIVLHLAGDNPARLIIPHGHAEDVIRQISPLLGKRDVQKSMLRKLVLWGAGAVASVVLILLVILPAMSDQLATMIPPEREAALGRTSLKQIEKYLSKSGKPLACRNKAGVAALDKMVARLSVGVDIPYDLNVQVFRYPMLNAFAVPGGNIVLFEGLIKASQTPEEVAGVLAHEIGHVFAHDPTRLTLRSAGSAGILGMVFGDFAGGFAALVITERLINASYAQAAEAGADSYAHGVLRKSGLPSAPLGDFFEKLKKKYGDKQGLMSHLASHPNLTGRAKAARAASTVSGMNFEPILSKQEWQDLRGICS